MTRRSASFGAALASSWALLLGFGILMLGDGLQGTLVLVSGLGAIIGPVLFAAVMERYGAEALFWAIAAVHAATGLFAIYRMARSAPVPRDKQLRSTATAVHPSGSAIDSVQQYKHDETEFNLDEKL